jgi:uncharacterized protein involved in outer membrane biogenesis
MKFLRIGISLVALLLLVCGLALAALYYFIDPNKLKPVIIAEVKKQSGYTLSIDGALSWTFYPRLAIRVPEMTLTAPGQTKPMASLHDVRMMSDLRQLMQGGKEWQGRLRIANLDLMNVHITNIKTTLHWQNDALVFDPMTASFYQGDLTGVATGHLMTKQPRWDWNVTLTGVQVKPLFADLNPENKLMVSGSGDVTMRAMTQGKTREQMIAGLNGSLQFNVSDGKVSGIDINYLVQTADALLNKQPVSLPQDVSQTQFDSLKGDVVMTNGVADITSLQLTAPAFVTSGKGTIDLSSGALDVKLQTAPQQQLKNKWDIPILVAGNVRSPQIKLDTDQLTKYTIKQQIDKVKDKAREAVQEHVKGDAGKLLQKLLSR